MKRASIIILCLMVSLTKAQTTKQLLDSLNSEDPNTITEFDRNLASKYDVRFGCHGTPECKAWQKIQRIEYEIEKKRKDSLAAAEKETQRKYYENEQIERRSALVKKYGEKTGKKLFEGKVWIGMTEQMTRDAFGPPEIKREVTASGTTEKWFYLPTNPNCVGLGCTILDYYMVFKGKTLVAVGDL